MTNTASIKLCKNDIVSPIDNRIYGSFIEHFGRAVYTGIFEPGHPTADDNSFRRDVIDLVKQLNIPVIRYPGGNFVSGYEWEDGVGPVEERRPRLDLAWSALESNRFGLNEFYEWSRLVNAQMMLAVNLGTRGPRDAQNLVEYCNFPGGSYYSNLRKKHGYEKPHGIKLWCLGNEMDGPWQICTKTAEEYGRVACETAKLMKWVDPSIELVVCGSSGRGMPTFGVWEETVLSQTYEHVDYISLHTYYGNEENDTKTFLARGMEMDRFIKEVAKISEKVRIKKGLEKKVYLSFDEWNVWYHYRISGQNPPKWTEARPIEEELYNVEDALLVGSMLITFINNADTVKIACLAQLVNTIAPIMTEKEGKAWTQTIFYPFMYTSLYGRGTALRQQVDCPTYTCGVSGEIPMIDSAAVYNEQNHEVVLFMVNRSLDTDISTEISLEGFDIEGVVQHLAIDGYDLKQTNGPDEQTVVPIEKHSASQSGEGISVNLSKASWNMIRIKLK